MMRHMVCALAGLGMAAAAGTAWAGTPYVNWTTTVGTTADDRSGGLAVDPLGNAYLTGYTRGDFAGGTNTLSNAFVSKVDAAGNVLWTTQYRQGFQTDGRAAVADANGVYVAGWVHGTLPGHTSKGSPDAFLFRYDGAGNLQWTKELGTSHWDDIRGLARDAAGNLYLAGDAWGGDYSLSNRTVLIKTDANGNELWTRELGGPTSRALTSQVTVDRNGSIYMVGTVDGAFDGQTQIGGRDFFLVKYDADGNRQWTRQWGTTTTFEEAFAVAVDNHGGVFVTGYTHGNLGGTGANWSDIFLTKYSDTGELQWNRQFVESNGNIAKGLVVTPENIYIAAHEGGGFGEDYTLRKLDLDGHMLDKLVWGTGFKDYTEEMAFGPNGTLYVAHSTESNQGMSTLGAMDAQLSQVVIPLPPAVWMGVAALAAAGSLRTRMRSRMSR